MIHRRDFLKVAAAAPAVAAAARFAWPSVAWGEAKPFVPTPGNWRLFEVTTKVEVLRPKGGTRVWLPTPLDDATFQRLRGPDFVTGNARGAEQSKKGAAFAYHYAEFGDGEAAPVVELTSRIATQDRAVDWATKRGTRAMPMILAPWTKATRLLPTDGDVGKTAAAITQNATTDVEKVRAIYDWVVSNTRRDPQVRGCGTGDAAALLASETHGGKCADINGLFVALVRSAGIPARDVYGIRVAPSGFGYKSLGAASETITKSQHCRAEVHLADYGWVAMDPADVAKVAREETGEPLPLDDSRVVAARAALFGSWEGNWIAFNTAHDVVLPHAADRTPLAFFMYPQCETGGERRDPLDPDNFRYAITARELEA